MKVERKEVPQAELLNPSSAIWSDFDTESISLSPVPLDAQPNEYIRASRAEVDYGQTAEICAAALESDGQLYVRLQWQDDEKPNGEFADAAAVVLGKGDTISTLGAPQNLLSLWYWAADRNEALHLYSAGPGVVSNDDSIAITAEAKLQGDQWSVVLTGPVNEVQDSQLGFAVWNGSNQERAGLAAISKWQSLDME